MKEYNFNVTKLFSINGDGIYTGREVADITGNSYSWVHKDRKTKIDPKGNKIRLIKVRRYKCYHNGKLVGDNLKTMTDVGAKIGYSHSGAWRYYKGGCKEKEYTIVREWVDV